MNQTWFIQGPTNIPFVNPRLFAEIGIPFKCASGHIFFTETIKIDLDCDKYREVLTTLDSCAEHLQPRYTFREPRPDELFTIEHVLTDWGHADVYDMPCQPQLLDYFDPPIRITLLCKRGQCYDERGRPRELMLGKGHILAHNQTEETECARYEPSLLDFF